MGSVKLSFDVVTRKRTLMLPARLLLAVLAEIHGRLLKPSNVVCFASFNNAHI
jgi:hypothetical protein